MATNELKALTEIFNNTIFRIPDYQRGYAWGEEQLKEFWEDLQNLDLERIRYHYTGLLTIDNINKEYVKSLENWKDDLWVFERGFEVFYIIDGQQRLITIIVLIKVIIDRFDDDETINFYKKNDLRKRFLYEKVGRCRSFIFGYEKDDPSDQYFRTRILGQHSSREDRVQQETLYTANLQFAKNFFEDKIKDFSKKELDTLLYKILNGLKFHIYEIDEEIDVFLRFETLNNRGKPLSKLELLKNRLIYLTTLLPNKDASKNELRKDINEVWKQVYEHLGKNKGNPLDDEHFLENHWIMYFKTEKSESENYLRFLLNEYFIPKNVLDNEPKIGFGEIKSYVDSMSESVRKWFAIFNPSFSDYSEETKEWLQRLNRTGFGAFKPLIMAAMVKRIDEEKLIALLKSVQRFELTMYRLVMTKSKYRDSHFYRMANDLYHEKDERTIDDIIEDIDMQKEREVFSLFHMGKSDVNYPTIG